MTGGAGGFSHADRNAGYVWSVFAGLGKSGVATGWDDASFLIHHLIWTMGYRE